MNRTIAATAVLIAFLGTSVAAAGREEVTPQRVKKRVPRLSYALGMDVGNALKALDTTVNLPVLFQAIDDALEKDKTLLTPVGAGEVKEQFADAPQTFASPSAAPAASDTDVDKKVTADDLKTPADKLSYALGMEVAGDLKRLDARIDFASFFRAVEDTYGGDETLITAQEADDVKKAFIERRKSQRESPAVTNQREGRAFLEENKKKERVEVRPSGLQYLVLEEGTGSRPKAHDRVKVNYRGTLIDGTEFDSSFKRGKPAVFGVNAVIPGWTEALQLMPVGSKWRLFIPAKLAYGSRGSGRAIGPNAALIFDVELLDIER